MLFRLNQRTESPVEILHFFKKKDRMKKEKN